MTENQFLPISQIINLAKLQGIFLGRGNPYHRLRYFIKLGLLPNANRRYNPETGKVEGHLPLSVLQTIKKINNLDDQGLTRSEIKNKLIQNKLNSQEQTPLPTTAPTKSSFLHIFGIVSLALIVIFLTAQTLIRLFFPDLKIEALKHLASLLDPFLVSETQIIEKVTKITEKKDQQILGEQDEDLPIIIASPRIDSTSDNLLKNSSFEFGEDDTFTGSNEFGQPKHWGYTGLGNKENIFVSTQAVRSGTLGLKLQDKAICPQNSSTSCPNATLGIIQKSTKLRKGTNYNLSIFIRTNSITGSPSLRLGFTGLSETFQKPIHKFQDFSLKPEGVPTTTWKRFEFAYENAGIGVYPFIEIKNYQGGIIHFDDAQLTEGKTPVVFHRENITIGDGSLFADQLANIYPVYINSGSLGLATNPFSNIHVNTGNFLAGVDIKEDLQVDGQLKLGSFLTNPTALGDGTLVFNDSDSTLYVWNGSSWSALGGGGTTAGFWQKNSGVLAPNTTTDDLAIGGTNLASSIFSIDESAGTFLFGGDHWL
jgi:hypothetical protein